MSKSRKLLKINLKKKLKKNEIQSLKVSHTFFVDQTLKIMNNYFKTVFHQNKQD